ncbi:hypothetical protein Ait01nite_007030 [Actinoplanes italicus]|nr:hypothetical protein Ait01nite_007030 [Actinoplanes italicus]
MIPAARIAPATPPKIINCRLRRCAPSGRGGSGGAGGCDLCGGTPYAVTIPDDHVPPGRSGTKACGWGSDMHTSEHHDRGERRGYRDVPHRR